MRLKLLAVCAAILGTIAAGQAAVITRTFDVKASDFTLFDGPGSVAPVDPVEFKFTLTFDPSTTIWPTTTGLTILTLNLSHDIEYAYVASATEPALVIGTAPGISPPQTNCILDAGDWCMNMSDPAGVPAAPNVTLFQQVTAADDSTWSAQRITTSVFVGSTAPEPASWVLLVGFAGAAGGRLLWRRHGSALRAATADPSH